MGREAWGRGPEEEALQIEEEVKKAGRALRNEIRRVKRKTWEEFLHKADGNNVWSVMTYTRPQRGTSVPTISHEGNTADTNEEKAQMLMGISFPPPIPYRASNMYSAYLSIYACLQIKEICK